MTTLGKKWSQAHTKPQSWWKTYKKDIHDHACAKPGTYDLIANLDVHFSFSMKTIFDFVCSFLKKPNILRLWFCLNYVYKKKGNSILNVLLYYTFWLSKFRFFCSQLYTCISGFFLELQVLRKWSKSVMFLFLWATLFYCFVLLMQ